MSVVGWLTPHDLIGLCLGRGTRDRYGDDAIVWSALPVAESTARERGAQNAGCICRVGSTRPALTPRCAARKLDPALSKCRHFDSAAPAVPRMNAIVRTPLVAVESRAKAKPTRHTRG